MLEHAFVERLVARTEPGAACYSSPALELSRKVVNLMNIRPFSKKDLKRCQEIAKSTYDYAHVLDLDAAHIIVAEDRRKVVGFGYIHVWQWNKVAWLGDLIVDESHRGRGIGTQLVKHLADLARKEGCLALMDHPPSRHPVIGFYLKLGFRICGYNDSYFSESQDRIAIFMCLDL